jgi:hypothetical protein
MDNAAPHCIAFGGLRFDDAIQDALLTVVEPGAIAAAEKQAGQRRDQVREALHRDLEAARYAADPVNRLVAGALEQACYKARDDARHNLFNYIEAYYNRQRLRSALE